MTSKLPVSKDFDLNVCFRAQKATGTFQKLWPVPGATFLQESSPSRRGPSRKELWKRGCSRCSDSRVWREVREREENHSLPGPRNLNP